MRDVLCLLLVLGLPVYLVLREDWRGVIAGALLMWLIGYLVLEIPRGGDPKNESLGAAFWAVSGWLVSLVYCGAIYGGHELVRRNRRKTGASIL